jgi:hypothetical protein
MHETTRAVRPAATLLALLLLLTSCAGLAAPTDAGTDGLPSASADASQRPAPSGRQFHTAPPSGEQVIGEVPDDLLDAILAAAAEHSGLSASDIEVVQAEQVTWPDGSLGCPEPDQMYTQALVEGYQVVLDAGGEELDYRVGSGGSFRLCEGGGPREGG